LKTNYIAYDYIKSFERIDKIIEESDNSFEELNSIPVRDKLTYTNGFYVNCSAIFVDIRESSKLTGEHLRPKLAKLYRVFISEVVAVMNGSDLCNEINIIGDCVSGVFNTPHKENIDGVFHIAAKISSLIKVMNYKFKKNDIEQIRVGIGISYGRALMIKAGYNGSSINDVVWMGDVVNEASKLSNKADNNYIIVSSAIYNKLNDHNKNLLIGGIWTNYYSSGIMDDYYRGNVVHTPMNDWYNENCK
jgi:class 3 adenylate cyclase